MRALKKYLPDPETIRSHRWLRWLGPALHHPRLWHVSRRGIAMGMALGFFFGLLVPVAQIPLSAAAAVALRANIPAAVASTLVTNPLTFGPLYYGAWKLGGAILGETAQDAQAHAVELAEPDPPDESWWQTATRRVMGVGKPLLLGLAIMACAVGLSAYLLISGVWRLAILWKRRSRLRRARLRPS